MKPQQPPRAQVRAVLTPARRVKDMMGQIRRTFSVTHGKASSYEEGLFAFVGVEIGDDLRSGTQVQGMRTSCAGGTGACL